MKKQVGVCSICRDPVYRISGRDIPKHVKQFVSEINAYVQSEKAFVCFECSGLKGRKPFGIE